MGDRKTIAHVMGILNVTPDSFSDGGSYYDETGRPDMDRVLKRVEEMIDEGADIIDVGGESTRPGAAKVSAKDEISLVVPVIREIKNRFNIQVSIDTYKSDTAIEAVHAGADIVNDIGMMNLDPKMASAVAGLNVRYILTHNSGKVVELNDNDSYISFFLSETKDAVGRAIKAGIDRSNIIIDPGIGFNKTYEQNLFIMDSLNRFCDLGYPVLLGTSRKSFIGTATECDVNERLAGTIATTVIGAMAGVSYFRVHDIDDNVRALMLTESVLGRCKE